MAFDKKGKGFTLPAPGKISAMFNRYNEQMDRDRVKTRQKVVKPVTSDDENALSDDESRVLMVNIVAPLIFDHPQQTNNMASSPMNATQAIVISDHTNNQDDTSTLMQQQDSRLNLRLPASMKHKAKAIKIPQSNVV